MAWITRAAILSYLLLVLLYFRQPCLLGMDIDNITPTRYTVYGVREGGGSR